MATRLNPTNFGYQNFYSTTLSGDITAGSLSIGLNTVPTPSSGILVIDPDSTSNREVVLYTSKGASTVTVPSDGRGYSGTTAVPHLQGTTVIMGPVDKWFTALASGELSTDPIRTELFFDYIASGMVWSGDSYGSTRNASMTSGVMYINGRRLTASAVTSRAFTASKDTYVDASDNGDGTVLLTYTEVANNAASPALAANSVRLAIIITGASNIANAGSINQGQETMVLPIASSTPYAVTDSLGNLICPRDPQRKQLGYRQVLTNQGGIASADLTGLVVPVNVPTGRKIKISASVDMFQNTTNNYGELAIMEGATTLKKAKVPLTAASQHGSLNPFIILTPSAGVHTYKLNLALFSGQGQTLGAADNPQIIEVELI